MLRALPLACLLVVGLSGAAVAKDETPPPTWKLHPSEVLHYERVAIPLIKGKPRRGAPTRLTVYGHDLRDEGQYAPVNFTQADLAALVGLRLVRTHAGETKWKRKLHLPRTAEISLRGKTRITGQEGALLRIEGTWTFSSRGGGERGDTHQLKKGKATSTTLFDPEKGHVTSTTVQMGYRRSKLKGSSADKPSVVDSTFEITLKHRYAFRYPDFQKDVDAAIDKGVAYLKTLQIKQVKEDDEHVDSYKPHGGHRIGSTALAVLTLAACGVPRTDPHIRKALDWLLTTTPKRTYERAICLMAFDKVYADPKAKPAAVPKHGKNVPKDELRWCREVADGLLASAQSPGTWGYPSNARTSLLVFDASNTQYAVLGMRAAERLGLEVPERHWLGVIRFFQIVREKKPAGGEVRLVREGQAVHDDGRYADAHPPEKVKAAGGFRYSTLDQYRKPWASMTCAGIACLALAQAALERRKSPKLTGALKKEIRALMLGAWAWLEAHWGMDRHPMKKGGAWFYYYVYSVERAAILDRVKRVGLKDWYFEGAVQLILRQEKDGAWGGTSGNRISQTCFALLFLKRATAPVAVITGD